MQQQQSESALHASPSEALQHLWEFVLDLSQARLCNSKRHALMLLWGQGSAVALGQHTKEVECMNTPVAWWRQVPEAANGLQIRCAGGEGPAACRC